MPHLLQSRTVEEYTRFRFWVLRELSRYVVSFVGGWELRLLEVVKIAFTNRKDSFICMRAFRLDPREFLDLRGGYE